MAQAFNLTAQLNLRGPTNVNAVVTNIRRQLGNISANVTINVNPSTANNIAQLNTRLAALNTTLRITTTRATSASQAIRQLGQAFSAVHIGNIPAQINAAATAIGNLHRANANVHRGLAQTSTEMEEFGRQAGLAIRRFSAFSTVSGVIFGLTNAVTQGLKAFIDYDREIVKLQQVTGESAAGLAGLGKTISNLATSLGVSSSELTSVASTLAQAGLSARDTEKALKALALSSLAPSFDDMNKTVEGSIALMRQFGISAGDLDKALGSINAVAAKFAVEASDIVTAIQRTGGVFATASKGVSEGTDALNEFMAIFTSVRATTRESAETIATGLRTIFTRVQRSSTIEALKEYGVNLQDLDGKFVGAYKAVELLSKGLSSIDPRDMKFSQIVEELGGFRQIGKVIPLIQQFTTTQEALKVAQQGQGSLAKDAATAQLSLANQIQKVKQEFLTLFRAIGSSDTFQVMIKGALNLSSAFIRIADSIKGILPALAIFAAFKGASAATQFIGGFAGAVRGGQRRAEGGPIRRFASGGFVPGSGDGDTVPARLTPGEFVIRKKAVQAIGVDNLHQMNRYADGGSVRSSKNTGNVSRGNRYFDGGTVKELMSKTKGGSTIANYQKNNSDIIHDGDRVKSDRDSIKYRLTDDDKQELFNSTLNTSGGRNRFVKGGIKRYNKVEWANAFESIIAKKYDYSKTSDIQKYGPSFAQDLENAKGEFAEVKFTKNPVSLEHLVSKKLRTILQTRPKSSWGFTPSPNDQNDLGPIKVFELAEGEKEKFTNEYKTKKFDPKYNPKRLNTGGLVQKFAAGDVVKRSIGYLDSDVLADPENSAIVGPEMERLQLKKISEYKMYLSQLAIGSRKKGDLSKFTSLVGVAGAGKSSLVQGRGTDTGRLRQTNRFPILTAQDISRATEVLDITSTVTPEKLGAYLTQSDKIISLSSSTKEEMQEIRRRRGERVITGKNLFGREPNSTDKAPTDSGPLEAMLASEIDAKKIRTLGVKTGGGFNIKRDTGISVENTKIASFTGFVGPPQRGHESQMDISASLGFKPENFIAVVSGNEAIDSSNSDPHSYRSAVLDQDSRTILARAAFEARGGRVAKLPQDAGFKVPNILEIEGGKNGKRHFVRGLKGSVALSQGKRPDQTKKYTDAGFISHNIEERTGGFSGTEARQAILDGNIPALQQMLSPGVFALVSKNLSQIQNRANILPKIISKIEQNKQKSLAPIKQQLDAFPIQRVDNKKLAAEGPNSEYGRMVAQLRELRNSRDKIQNSGGFEPFSLMRKLEKRYPDRYRLNFGGTSSGLQEGILRAATSAKVSQQAEPLSPESLSFLESTLPKIPTKVESSVLDQFFKGKSIPKDPSIYGEFAGKYIDQVTKKVNRDSYSSQLTPEKLAYYSATKDFLYKGLSADKIAEREGIISSVAKSTKVGVVGLQPADFASVKQPQMLGGENTTMFIQGLSSKYQKDVGKVRKTLKRTIGAFGSNLEKTAGKSKTPLREMREEEENASGMANVEGAVLEMVLSRLGAVGGTVQNRAIDYPNGLGARAAKFFPGIGPNWPTEVKRTLDYDALSDAKDEFIRYFSEKNGVSIEKKTEPVKMMAGGKVKEVFGSGETKFPTSTKTAYEKATMKRRVRERFPDMNPTDERVFVDSSKVEEKFDSPEPFDLEKFKASFSGKVSRDSLITSLSDFAKFIGLPKDQLAKVLPTHLDFGGMGSMFHKMPTGSRGTEGFDLSSGWNEKDEQDLFGYEQLLEKKTKESAKIQKTPVRTFEDGSFSHDKEALQKNWDESNAIRTKIFELGEKKRKTENSVIKEKTDFAKQTGRGVITLGGNNNYRPSNHVLYHELTHQLFNGLSAGSSDVFAKYSQRVDSLFDGDNNQLAEAFDALGEYEYKSADVVYGRSYKSSRLTDIIREKARKREKDGVAGVEYDPKEFDEAVILKGKAEAAKKAMQFKPLNPNVNKTLLDNHTSQEVINAYEDSGKQEFLTTLVQKLPTLDSHLQSILNSTIESLLGDAGIKRQKFAIGGSAKDTVPALLTPGEFVINKNAADRIGLDNLHKLNHADKISRFNKGGSVGGIQRFVTGGTVETQRDILTANSPRATDNGFNSMFRRLSTVLVTTNQQFADLATSVTNTGARLGNFNTLQAAAGNKNITQIKRAIQADIAATAAAGNMATQTEALRNVLTQVEQVEQAATASIRDTVEARKRTTVSGRIREGLQGQGGFYATAALGALGGQAENIFGKKTSSATSAYRSARMESATSTASTGLALASQALNIPGTPGLVVAGVIAVGTAIAAWSNSVEAGIDALNVFNTDLKNKKIEDANERLATSFNNFSKDLNNVDLANIVKGDIKGSVGSINAGTGQDIINKQRDMRKEQISKMSFIEYGNSFLPGQFSEPVLGATDYTAATKESAKKLEPAKEASMVIFEQMLKKGETSLQDFATSTDEFAVNQRKAIVLSDPTAMGKYAEMQARASAAIQNGNHARAAEIQLEAEQFVTSQALDNAQLKSIESSVALNKAMEDASKAGRQLAESFTRLTDSLNQALDKTTFQLAALDDTTQSMIQSFSGDAKNQVVRSEAANTLANPKAYSDQKVEAAIKQAVNMVGGSQSQEGAMMEGILSLNHTLEKQMAGSVRAEAGNNAGLTIEQGVSIAQKSGIAEIQASALPQQSKDLLVTQLTEGLKGVKGKLSKETTGESSGKLELDKLEAELKDAAKIATEGINKELNETAKKLLEFRADSFNKYTESLNLVAEKQIEAASFYQKAADIGTEGAQKLREALTGASTSLGDVVANKVNQTARLTGVNGAPGVVDPALIAANIRNLDARAVTKQAQVKDEFNKGNMGDAVVFNDELSDINIQLKNNHSALKNLASDTELVSAAMGRLNEVTKAQEATKNASEKLLTSDKKGLRQQSQIFNRLQARNNGQLVRSTPEQRAQEFDFLRNFKDIFTAQYQRNATVMKARGVNIDNSPQAAEQKYNELYARVTESMFHSSGGIGTYGPGGTAVIDQSVSMSRNKANDPLYAEAVTVYRDAISIQRNANTAIGNLTLELSRNLMGDAVTRFSSSLPTFLDNLKQARDKDASTEHPIVVNGKVVNVNTIGQPKIADLAADYQPPAVAAPVMVAQGGLIYASAGKYVNFEPRGTDTVPAMLTPGEFVVNAQSTAQHLPLLKAINRQQGGVVYLAGGSPDPVKPALDAGKAIAGIGKDVAGGKVGLGTASNLFTVAKSAATYAGSIPGVKEAGGIGSNLLSLGSSAGTIMSPESSAADKTKAAASAVKEGAGLVSNVGSAKTILPEQTLKALGSTAGKIATLGGAAIELGMGAYKGYNDKEAIKSGMPTAGRLALGAISGSASSGESLTAHTLGIENDQKTDEQWSQREATLRGATIGGSIGSAFPVVGTAIGAGVGAGVGFASETIKVGAEALAIHQDNQNGRIAQNISRLEGSLEASRTNQRIARDNPEAQNSGLMSMLGEIQNNDKKSNTSSDIAVGGWSKGGIVYLAAGGQAPGSTPKPFDMTDEEKYSSQAADLAPKSMKELVRGSAGNTSLANEAIRRGMTVAEILYERQQAYLSNFNNKTRKIKEKEFGSRLLAPSERMIAEKKANEARLRVKNGGDPYADQKDPPKPPSNVPGTSKVSSKMEDNRRITLGAALGNYKRAAEEDPEGLRPDGKTTNKAFYDEKNSQYRAMRDAYEAKNPEIGAKRQARTAAATKRTTEQRISDHRGSINKGLSDINQNRILYLEIRADLAKQHENMSAEDLDSKTVQEANRLSGKTNTAQQWTEILDPKETINQLVANGVDRALIDSYINGQNQSNLGKLDNKTAPGSGSMTKEMTVAQETIKNGAGLGRLQPGPNGLETADKNVFGLKRPMTDYTDRLTKDLGQAIPIRNLTAVELQEQREKENELLDRQIAENQKASAKREQERAKVKKVDLVEELEKRIAENKKKTADALDEIAARYEKINPQTEEGKKLKSEADKKIADANLKAYVEKQQSIKDNMKQFADSKPERDSAIRETVYRQNNAKANQEQANAQAQAQAQMAAQEKKRKDNMWVNSKHTPIALAGYALGLVSSGTTAVRGALTAGTGAVLTAASHTGIVDALVGSEDKKKEAAKDAEVQRLRAIQAQNPNNVLVGNQFEGGGNNVAALEESKRQDKEFRASQGAGVGFRNITHGAMVAGAQDIAGIANALTAGKAEETLNSFGNNLGTNIFGTYGEDSVGKMNSRNSEMMSNQGNHLGAFITDFSNTAAAGSINAIPAVASLGTTSAVGATSVLGKIGQSMSYVDNLFSSPGSLVNMFGKGAGTTGKILGAADNVVGGFGQKALKGVSSFFDLPGTMGKLQELGSLAKNTASPLLSKINKVGSKVGSSISDSGIGQAVKATSQGIDDVSKVFLGGLEDLGSTIGKPISGAMRGVKNTISGAAEGTMLRVEANMATSARASRAQQLRATRASTLPDRIARKQLFDKLNETSEMYGAASANKEALSKARRFIKEHDQMYGTTTSPIEARRIATENFGVKSFSSKPKVKDITDIKDFPARPIKPRDTAELSSIKKYKTYQAEKAKRVKLRESDRLIYERDNWHPSNLTDFDRKIKASQNNRPLDAHMFGPDIGGGVGNSISSPIPANPSVISPSTISPQQQVLNQIPKNKPITSKAVQQAISPPTTQLPAQQAAASKVAQRSIKPTTAKLSITDPNWIEQGMGGLRFAGTNLAKRERELREAAQLAHLPLSNMTKLQQQQKMKSLIEFYKNNSPAAQTLSNGGVVYASNGALISARNMGTDTVPAMLTPGEFVVNKNAASSHMGLLQSINRSKGGSVNYLANGGFVSPRYYSAGSAVGPNGTVHQNNNGGVSNGGSGSSFNEEILADFQSQFKQAVSTLGSYIDSFSQSTNAFGGVSATMNNSLSGFVESVKDIPEELIVKGTVNTEARVRVDGGQALAAMGPAMENYTTQMIANTLGGLNTGLEGVLFTGDINPIIGKGMA